jgi:hypothetical protein
MFQANEIGERILTPSGPLGTRHLRCRLEHQEPRHVGAYPALAPIRFDERVLRMNE